MGVSTTSATSWWREAGAMPLLRGQNSLGTHGLSEPGDRIRPGGRGHRLSHDERITMAPVYFCDPHSPWQRGTSENTNRLLRFWFEKSTDLSVHTKADLKRVQDTLNRRPRPTLDLDTPADRLAALINQAA
jgi:hypothetical protein